MPACSWPFRQRLDGYVRKHALCPRSQELQHLRTQRRKRQCYFDLEDPQYLDYFRYADPDTGKKVEDHLTGWQRIHVTNSEHPYMDKWWVPGCTIGYEHTFMHALADFLKGIETGQPAQPELPQRLANPEGLRRGAAKRTTGDVGYH